MSSPKPPSVTVFNWLRANLGPRALAPLTGTDSKALAAAVQIAVLYGYDESPEVAQAFGLVVGRMQESTRELAFHAIAHATDWGYRFQLWRAAGLEVSKGWRECSFGPGGPCIDLSKRRAA